MLCVLPTLLWAQKERRVYYLDCSWSMVQNKIQEPVCNNLINAINLVEDQTTELYVIPFAFDSDTKATLKPITANATEAGKAQLISAIKNLKWSQTTMTYLKDPVEDFDKRILPNGLTYMFLMTDGADEYQDKNRFLNDLRAWSGKYGQETVYGFYVMLDQAAHNPTIESIVDDQPHFWNVSSADVNIHITRAEDKAVFNIRNEQYVDIPVYGPTAGYEVEVTADSENYEIKNTELRDGKLRLHLTGRKEAALLPETENARLAIQVKKNPGEFYFWVTDAITVKCKSIPEPAITNYAIDNNSETKAVEKLGDVSYYDAFLFCGADTTSITKTIHFEFNADARVKGEQAYAEFTLVDMEGKPVPTDELRIKRGDTVLPDNSFRVTPLQPDVTLTFTYLPKAASGKHQGTLHLVSSCGLDRICNEEINQQGQTDLLKWSIRFDKKQNPLLIALYWIVGILVGALLAWFLLLRPQLYPHFGKFRKSVLIEKEGRIVGQSTYEFKNYRKVVFATARVKQSLWKDLFVGKIKTVVNPLFVQPLTITARRKGKTATAYGMGYIIRSNPMPRSGVTTVENMQQRIKMTFN